MAAPIDYNLTGFAPLDWLEFQERPVSAKPPGPGDVTRSTGSAAKVRDDRPPNPYGDIITMPGLGSVAFDPRYGGVPLMPSPLSTAAWSMTGNLDNLSKIFQLGEPMNAWAASQARVPYEMNLPDYRGMVAQSSKNIGSLLRGEVPTDVIAQIAQTRGGLSGVSGMKPDAGAFNAAIRSAVGKTSLDLMGAGESGLTGAIGRTPTGQQFNPYAFLVSPQEAQQASVTQGLYASLPYPAQASEEARRQMLAAYGLGTVSGNTWNRPVWGNVLSNWGTLYG